MIALIKWVVMTIYNILPNSPFTHMVDELELDRDFLQYVNWFLPLDIVGNMILAWLDCLLAYIVFKLVATIIFKIIIKKIATAISWASVLIGEV